MSTDKPIPDIPDEVIQSLARMILPSIRKYFNSEEGQKEFTERREKRQKEQAAAQAIRSK